MKCQTSISEPSTLITLQIQLLVFMASSCVRRLLMSTVLIEWSEAITNLMAGLITLKGNTIKNAVKVKFKTIQSTL